MKKLFTLLILLLGFNIVSAEECSSFYKVKLSIEGKGTIKAKLSDKVYDSDSTINIKCTDSFLFETQADEGYILDGVYINGNHITADKNNIYGLYDINSNANVKVTFIKTEAISENEMISSSYEDNISLFIKDIKTEAEKDTILRVILREITVLFDKEFIDNAKDNITIIASQIDKDEANYKQQKAAKNSDYYRFSIYNGENIINEFKGKATILLPYSKSDNVYIYKVGKDGRLTLMKSTYDKEVIKFDVKESGIYALSNEKLNEMNYIKSILDLNNQKVIALIGIGFALGLFILLLIIKRRK